MDAIQEGQRQLMEARKRHGIADPPATLGDLVADQLTRPSQTSRLDKKSNGFNENGREPDALTWTCESCGQPVTPLEVQLFEQTRYIRRRWCSCEGAQEAKRQERQRERDRKARMLITRAGLHHGKLARMTFAAWDIGRNPPHSADVLTHVTDYVENVADSGANWPYLHGPYGTGKTHLAIAALRKIAFDRFWTPKMVVWPAHCSAVQESWKRGAAGPSEAQLWGQMRGADVLLIDDIDKRSMTPWAAGKLYEIIDYRQIRERPTIITANHSLEALRVTWSGLRDEQVRDAGAAILSRIAGQLWNAVKFVGKDQRWAS